ncbi:odorant receptor 49a-like isoform X3 [Ceratina calcarata]|uniref:Odorant receptor 49a-like isoform X3 n=1 Tax=Ceratina calcarata TaxID=156304 RepID=A0AAJ7WEM4_9HYME|nr:odorant receptor 49a-like isoform X3 [Ceratina calcarata]
MFVDSSHSLGRYLTEIESAYAINLFVQVGVVIISFTITLFQAATVSFNMETYHYFGFAISQFVHIFFLTVQGQFVINLQDSIYIKTYETCWYRGNVKTQALFVMIQRRNLTPPQLTAGGLIELNLDTFAEVVKVCVSYCTVLRST